MGLAPYQALRARCRALSFDTSWAEALCALGHQRLANCPHGDFAHWRRALERLPRGAPFSELDRAAPRFGTPAGDPESLVEALMALRPWRKGPLEIAGTTIETEWRSDWKWSRIAPHVDLKGERILDIGCGNGYFGWRMLAAGAELVIGVDPTWVYVMQWLACRRFSGDLPNFVLPLGVEDLPGRPMLPDGPPDGAFDTVFSMGVLYHRRKPLHHLERLCALLRPGGRLVLETLVLPDAQTADVLQPAGRYARMRNLWAIPGCDRLLAWVTEAGFSGAAVVDVTRTTTEEQRSTAWMVFESLDKALDPADPRLTVEGYPAPRRAVLIARRAES